MSPALLDARHDSRSVHKRRLILEAATSLFLSHGYDGTSMDDIASTAAVSKPTVYKHFADKEQLFAEIVLATTDQAVALVQMVTDTIAHSTSVDVALRDLARQFIAKLMEPQLLRLRRLVIATADRFPDVGNSWYEHGFGRALEALAGSFELLSARGLLEVEDPIAAANHYVGLLLWIPVNRAMFGGSSPYTPSELDAFAESAVDVFLRAYGRAPLSKPSATRR